MHPINSINGLITANLQDLSSKYNRRVHMHSPGRKPEPRLGTDPSDIKLTCHVNLGLFHGI